MGNTTSFIPEDFQGLEGRQLLSYYDNPKNFDIPDNTKEVEALAPDSFPKNTTLLLTHGLFSLNSNDRKAVVEQIQATKNKASDALVNSENTQEQAYRLLRNFSDFGTRKVIRSMFPAGDDEVKGGFAYPENVIIPKSPRIKGDPAREIDADDFKRVDDFNGNILLPQDYLALDTQGEDNHQAYHRAIGTRLLDVETTQGGSITFDIHDTGVNMMGIDASDDTFREGGYPKMEIGTLEGDSCNPEILEFFAQQVEIYFGFKPHINQKYKGGYVTQRHGRDDRSDSDRPQKRNVLQIELGRYLYMKESTQQIDHEQTQKVGAALRMCIQITGEKFGPEYFNKIAA